MVDSKPKTNGTVHRYMLLSVTHAVSEVVSEMGDFLNALYIVLTKYPLKTSAALLVIALLMYLRMNNLLHLFVSPIVATVVFVYFDLLR